MLIHPDFSTWTKRKIKEYLSVHKSVDETYEFVTKAGNEVLKNAWDDFLLDKEGFKTRCADLKKSKLKVQDQDPE